MQEVPEPHLHNNLSFDEYARRYQALLYAADLAAHRNLPELLQELSRRLHVIFDFNFTNYALYDPEKNVMRLYILDETLRVPEQPMEVSVEGSPSGCAWAHQQPIALRDLDVEQGFHEAAERYKSKGLRSLIVLPMTTGRRRLGTLGFGRAQPTHYDEATVGFLQRVAGLVALALENTLTREAVTREEEQLRALTQLSIQLSERSVQAHKALQHDRERLETVLEINAALAASKLDLRQMFPAISRCLGKSILHDAAAVSLWDEAKSGFNFYCLEQNQLPHLAGEEWKAAARELTTEILARADGEILHRAEMEVQSLRFPGVQKALDAGLACWCIAAMKSPSRLVGVLYLGSRRDNAFTDQDLDLLKQVAAVLALFVENAQSHEALRRQKERLQMLFEISRTLISSLDPQKLFREISNCIRRVIAQDYADLALYDEAAGVLRIRALDFPAALGLITAETALKIEESPAGIAFHHQETTCFTSLDLRQIGSEFTKNLLAEGIHSICCFPLIRQGRILGTLDIASRKENAFSVAEIDLLKQVAPQVAAAVDNARSFSEIASLKDKLAKEKVYLEQEIREVLDFEDIVGQSPSLTRILEQVRTVAPSDASVLILGETGTGKELVARALHRMSSRHGGNFVKLNCAAIPTGLLESELFGHEKGAFTGAISQKIGRLELADKGTLFLDEVGEIPLELQPKLLRVLQDHEFERLGGTRTIRVNVRLLAATNRDLSQAVADREFRGDLYYRLHVFPVRMPALRDRPGDIPILARYFVQKFAGRMNKQIKSIPGEALQALEKWHWPGNIRELENLMERSVILTEGEVLRVPVSELCAVTESSPLTELHPIKPGIGALRGTLEELERQYILQVLRKAGGVIAGSRGAAALLGMKRTTLQSKMQRLGITREECGN